MPFYPIGVRYVAGMAALALVAGTAQAADNAIDIDQPSAAGQPITIENTAGTVTVHGQQRDGLHIGGQRGNEAQQVRVGKDSNGGLVIKVIYPNRAAAGQGTDLVVDLPAGRKLSIGTVSADIATDGTLGATAVQTVSGEVSLDAAAPMIRAHSVSGDIDVDLGDEAAGGLDLASVSGDLSYDGGLTAGARYDINDVSGDIELNLPAATPARYDLAALSGDIDSDFGPKPQRADGSPKLMLSFTQGRDGKAQDDTLARVSARSVSGDIALSAD